MLQLLNDILWIQKDRFGKNILKYLYEQISSTQLKVYLFLMNLKLRTHYFLLFGLVYQNKNA